MRRAFTLIEMLVAITIIAIMIAMLLPAVKQAKRITRYTICGTQQRQIMQALIGYAASNYNDFPHGYWAYPTVIGAASDIIELLQGTAMGRSEPGYDDDGPSVSVALNIMRFRPARAAAPRCTIRTIASRRVSHPTTAGGIPRAIWTPTAPPSIRPTCTSGASGCGRTRQTDPAAGTAGPRTHKRSTTRTMTRTTASARS